MAAARTTDEPLWQIPNWLRLELLAHLSVDGTSARTMSYEEFLDWAGEDTLAEWVDGKVVMASPASLRHQELVAFLGGLLATFTRLHALGTVISAPFQMKLDRSGREPDLLFVTSAHAARLHATYLEGPADLVVEILSPESAGRDRGDKFFEYQAAGVSEYWLIDPRSKRVEVYRLDAQGAYAPVLADAHDIFHSATIANFWLNGAWLWLDPLPAVDELLLEIAGDAYARALIRNLQRRGFLSAGHQD